MAMYVCYIDESGTPDIPGNTSHFVLAGLAIPIGQWKSIDEAISQILGKYDLGDAEFHTAWILRRYLEQNAIPDFEKLSRVARRAAVEKERVKELLKLQKQSSTSHKQNKNYRQVKKTYAHTSEYTHLTQFERMKMVQEVADLIGSWDRARLFAECIDKTHFNSSTSQRSVDEQAFEQVVSRFEQYMGKATGDDNFGLLVHDNNETVAKKHTELMRQFHRNGTLWTKIKRTIDTPLFVNSSLTRMVQMADLCAYALRRYFENEETDLFRRVFRRADRVVGTVVGIRHFSDLKCACEVCRAHKAPTVKDASARRRR
jgi:hypothetical protein